MKTILYVDDRPDEGLIEALQSAGYRVLVAETPEEAIARMRKYCVYLVIFDVRLRERERGNDPDDISGMELAKEQEFCDVPKIYYSAYDQESLKKVKAYLFELGVVDFLNRGEVGVEERARATIEKRFDENVHIRWDIQIGRQSLSLQVLLTYLLSSVQSVRRPPEELEQELWNILARLFVDYQQILFTDIWSHGAGWLLLPVSAFDERGTESKFMVFLAQRDLVKKEYANYLDFRRNYHSDWVPRVFNSTTRQYAEKQPGYRYYFDFSPHFAGTAYELLRNRGQEPVPFDIYLKQADTPKAALALKQLFDQSLERTGGRESFKDGRQAHRFCLSFYGLDDKAKDFQEQLTVLCQRVSQIVASQLSLTDFSFTLKEPNSSPIPYPNPLTELLNEQLALPNRLTRGMIHGRLNEKSIMNWKDESWLVNFLSVTEGGPLLADFVAVELTIKQIYADVRDPMTYFELEDLLVEDEDIYLITIQPDSDLAKVIGSIRHLRQMAQDLTGATFQDYCYVLFMATLEYLAQFDSTQPYQEQALIRFAQALVSAAVLYREQLALHPPPDLPLSAYRCIWIPKTAERDYKIWVEGDRVTLTRQTFVVLKLMYDSPGKPVENKRFYQQLFPDSKDNAFPYKIRELVHTVRSRLVKKIQPHVKSNHEYIGIQRDVGYFFTHNPTCPEKEQ